MQENLLILKSSIENLPQLEKILKNSDSLYLRQIYDELDTLEDIFKLIDKAIVDDPPFSVREGGMIKQGYSPEADSLIQAKIKWLGMDKRT